MTGIPVEYTSWNPESKTVLDSLTWGKTNKKKKIAIRFKRIAINCFLGCKRVKFVSVEKLEDIYRSYPS